MPSFPISLTIGTNQTINKYDTRGGKKCIRFQKNTRSGKESHAVSYIRSENQIIIRESAKLETSHRSLYLRPIVGDKNSIGARASSRIQPDFQSDTSAVYRGLAGAIRLSINE